MLQGIASEVRVLNTSEPLMNFRNGRIKVLCLGNCVVNKLASLFKLIPGVDAVFCSNLPNWGNFHRETLMERAAEADHIISLRSASSAVWVPPEDLRRDFGGKTVFVPFLWLDGLASIEAFSVSGNNRIFGAGNLVEEARRTSFDAMTHAFLRGEIRTDPQARFTASIENIRELERDSIPISDYLLDTYRDAPIANAIGHPSNIVVRELFLRTAKEIGLDASKVDFSSPTLMGRLTLPRGTRAFTPYDVEDLGLTFPPDVAWLLEAKRILFLVKSSFRSQLAARS